MAFRVGQTVRATRGYEGLGGGTRVIRGQAYRVRERHTHLSAVQFEGMPDWWFPEGIFELPNEPVLADPVPPAPQNEHFHEFWLVVFGGEHPHLPQRSALSTRESAERKVASLRNAGFHIFATKKIKVRLEV